MLWLLGAISMRAAFYPGFPGALIQAGPMWPMIEKGNGLLRHKFSKAEDELLKQLVIKYGEANWMAVAAIMKTRTPRQCRERYKNYLSTKIKNDPWTEEEETLLKEKVNEYGQKWAKIALFFESRSDVNVKNHWTAIINRESREKKSEMVQKAKLHNEEPQQPHFPIPEIIQKFQIPMQNQLQIESSANISVKAQKEEGDNMQTNIWMDNQEADGQSNPNSIFFDDTLLSYFL